MSHMELKYCVRLFSFSFNNKTTTKHAWDWTQANYVKLENYRPNQSYQTKH